MAVVAATSGDVALIILAAFWGVLVLFLCVVLINMFRTLESTKLLIDGIREGTVPLLAEVKGTVERANRELDHVDVMLVSSGEVVKRVEKVSGLVEKAASGPLIKAVAFGAGVSKAASRFRGGKDGKKK
jgi:uncharacterized protein YoxC